MLYDGYFIVGVNLLEGKEDLILDLVFCVLNVFKCFVDDVFFFWFFDGFFDLLCFMFIM